MGEGADVASIILGTVCDMKYEFFADSIDIGVDEAEEVYSVKFTDSSSAGGPAESYLILQRSVTGIDDPDIPEPYIELNDPVNGGFANRIASGELLPTYLHLALSEDANIVVEGHGGPTSVSEIVVRYKADAPTLRKFKYALDLVIADAFPWKSIA